MYEWNLPIVVVLRSDATLPSQSLVHFICILSHTWFTGGRVVAPRAVSLAGARLHPIQGEAIVAGVGRLVSHRSVRVVHHAILWVIQLGALD